MSLLEMSPELRVKSILISKVVIARVFMSPVVVPYLAWALVNASHFHLSLIFRSKAGAYLAEDYHGVAFKHHTEAKVTYDGTLTEGKGSLQLTSLITSAAFHIAKNKLLFAKQATLMRRSRVLSLPLQLVFPA